MTQAQLAPRDKPNWSFWSSGDTDSVGDLFLRARQPSFLMTLPNSLTSGGHGAILGNGNFLYDRQDANPQPVGGNISRVETEMSGSSGVKRKKAQQK